MSPQRSNRSALVEGTLRCLQHLPPERVTARAIAEESNANLASIAYHFGSKDELVTEAVIAGLDRWLVEVDAAIGDDRIDPWTSAGVAVDARGHDGLARGFAAAIARGLHDPRVSERLAGGFRRTRPRIARMLGLGDDQVGEDAAGLVHSLFVGLLLQQLLDQRLGIAAERRERALARLRTTLPS
jgi:AcrR family transcriptional regulator